VIDKTYLNLCTEFAMQIIKIKIKVFERKMGFSEIKKFYNALLFAVCLAL